MQTKKKNSYTTLRFKKKNQIYSSKPDEHLAQPKHKK